MDNKRFDFVLDREPRPDEESAAAEVVAGYPGVTAEQTREILEALGIIDAVRAQRVGRVSVVTEPDCGPQAGDLTVS